MRHKRTNQIRFVLAAIGVIALVLVAFASSAKAQAAPMISLSAEVPGKNIAMNARMQGGLIEKELFVGPPDRPFKLKLELPSAGFNRCQEFAPNSMTALSSEQGGSGWRAAGTIVTDNIKPGDRLYPKVGETKYLVIRCLSSDLQTTVSDSIKIVRQ